MGPRYMYSKQRTIRDWLFALLTALLPKRPAVYQAAPNNHFTQLQLWGSQVTAVVLDLHTSSEWAT